MFQEAPKNNNKFYDGGNKITVCNASPLASC